MCITTSSPGGCSSSPGSTSYRMVLPFPSWIVRISRFSAARTSPRLPCSDCCPCVSARAAPAAMHATSTAI